MYARCRLSVSCIDIARTHSGLHGWCDVIVGFMNKLTFPGRNGQGVGNHLVYVVPDFDYLSVHDPVLYASAKVSGCWNRMFAGTFHLVVHLCLVDAFVAVLSVACAVLFLALCSFPDLLSSHSLLVPDSAPYLLLPEFLHVGS